MELEERLQVIYDLQMSNRSPKKGSDTVSQREQVINTEQVGTSGRRVAQVISKSI